MTFAEFLRVLLGTTKPHTPPPAAPVVVPKPYTPPAIPATSIARPKPFSTVWSEKQIAVSERHATDYIVAHVTATPEGRDYTLDQINAMHLARGFKKIGYHFLIHPNGNVEAGRRIMEVGAHVDGHNSNTVSFSLVGGLAADGKTSKDTRTAAQKAAMIDLVSYLHTQFPRAKVLGHRDFSPDRNKNGRVDPNERIKDCPCFDAIPWAASLGFPAGL